jgi:uncharacterized protein YndB with AHSA1/START domain
MNISEKMLVQQEEYIHATPQQVWETLAGAEGIKQWLGPSQYEPRMGGPITFDVNYDSGQYHMFGEVVTFDPPHKLAFTWTEQEIGKDPWPVATLVTLTLTPEDGGTKVKLVHSGFEHLPIEIVQAQFESYTQGWAVRPVLQGLKSLIESK